MLPQKRGQIPSRIAMSSLWKVLGIFLLSLPSALCLQPVQPRVLLVSFDGFRWDYIYRVPTPNFHYAMKSGVHVRQVTNVFITKTYPNHYTLVTGLYAESHGIVANEMYDPVLNETFSLNKMNTHNSKFWEEASPIWVTNQKEGHKSGAAMWPGTDVKIHGVLPTHYMPYNESVPFEDRVAKLIEWFTSEEPINFGLLYWEQPDETGHVLGPENPLMEAIISDIDRKLGYLISELKKAKLWDVINVIVTSDHGMSQSSSERLIELDQYVSRELYKVIDHSPAVAILPKEGRSYNSNVPEEELEYPNFIDWAGGSSTGGSRTSALNKEYLQDPFVVFVGSVKSLDELSEKKREQICLLLTNIAKDSLVLLRSKLNEVFEALANAHPNMTVYKKEQIPDRFHYKHNRKIQPILAVADKGWEIVHNKTDGFLFGNHGYDNTVPEMHPIFVAVGPAFRKNATKQFMNATDLYPLLCHLLGINALPNNGSFNAVKDILAEKVPGARRADSYSTVIGVFLGSLLVLVFTAVFVKHFVLAQANSMQIRHTEVAQPLLQD